MNTIRYPLVLALITLASCASTTQVILEEGTAGFSGGGPLAVRPGSSEVAYISGGEVIAVDADEGILDHLLLEDASSMIDIGFRSDEEMVVLQRSGLALYFAGKLFHSYDLDVSGDSLLAASDESLWVARNEPEGATLLRLDEERKEFLPVAALEDPVRAIACAPGGCYFAVGDAVYRLHLDGDGTGEILFLFAALGAEIQSIAADPDRGLILASSGEETLVYHEGRTRIFEALGGRLAYDDGTLFISSGQSGVLMRITRVGSRLDELESEDP